MLRHEREADRARLRDDRAEDDAEFPSEGEHRLSPFDRFATATSVFVSRAWFFMACMLIFRSAIVGEVYARLLKLTRKAPLAAVFRPP